MDLFSMSTLQMAFLGMTSLWENRTARLFLTGNSRKNHHENSPCTKSPPNFFPFGCLSKVKLWECPNEVLPWLSWPWFPALGAAAVVTGGDGGVGRRGGIGRRKEGGGCTGRAAAVAGGVDTGETLPVAKWVTGAVWWCPAVMPEV